MLKTKTIHPQLSASNPKRSCWVNASAGTGKTKVLIDRILRLLLSGVPFDRILCLTYTNAAAQEIKERLITRLNQWAERSTDVCSADIVALGVLPQDVKVQPETLRDAWCASPTGIAIQTLHGFCQKLLHMFPLEANIPPYFSVMDIAQVHQRFESAIKDVALKNPALLEGVLQVRTWKGILEILHGLFAERYHWIERGGGRKILASLSKDLGVNDGQKYFISPHLCEIDAIITQLNTEGVRAKKTAQALSAWASSTDRHQDTLSVLTECFLTKSGTIRQNLYPKKWLIDYADWANILDALSVDVLHYAETVKKKRIQDFSTHIITFFDKAFCSYIAWKMQNSFLDYDDLIFKTQELLHTMQASEWVRYKLDLSIDHVLLDEAQDTNPAQWKIIQKIIHDFFDDCERKATRTLFVVGDTKQSIFSFQGADIAFFQDIQNTFLTKTEDIQSLTLDTSFRTTEPILNFVDAVFARYKVLDHVPVHICHRIGQGGRIEIWPLVSSSEATSAQPWKVADKLLIEKSTEIQLADMIANKIENWLQDKKFLEGTNRLIAPKDIMILVRKRDSFVGAIIKSLKNRSIPVSGDEKIALSTHLFIKDMQALSDFLLLPQNDMALALILKSPIIGMTEEDLCALAAHDRQGSLWCALKNRARKNEAPFHNAYVLLRRLLNKVDYLTPYALYMNLLYKHKKWQAYLARMGPEVSGIIEEFLAIFRDEIPRDLDGFWRHFEKAKHMIVRPVEENAVRVMTVHGSKGLQSPIVILPDTTQVPRTLSPYFWSEAGLICVPSSSDMVPGIESLKEAVQQEQMDEYYRLLYVAMTRAEESLYIGGWAPVSGVPEASWYSLLSTTAENMPQFYDGVWAESGCSRAAEQEGVTKSRTFRMPDGMDAAPTKRKRCKKNDGAALPKLYDHNAAEVGMHIHCLLEHAADIPIQDRLCFVHKFSQDHNLDLGARQAVESLLNNELYQNLLALPHQTELPIIGTYNGVPIKCRIDFCSVDKIGKKIYVLDYKAVHSANTDVELKKIYQLQMARYKVLLTQIYAAYDIKCMIVVLDIQSGSVRFLNM